MTYSKQRNQHPSDPLLRACEHYIQVNDSDNDNKWHPLGAYRKMTPDYLLQKLFLNNIDDPLRGHWVGWMTLTMTISYIHDNKLHNFLQMTTLNPNSCSDSFYQLSFWANLTGLNFIQLVLLKTIRPYWSKF